MWHVPAAEFAFCLGNECLRWNDFLEEQSTVQFSVFPSMSREAPAWEREADSPQLPSPQGAGLQLFGNMTPEIQQQSSQADQTGDLSVISASVLHSLSAPEPWRALPSLLSGFVSSLLLTHCSRPIVGTTYRRLLEGSTEVFGFDGMGRQAGKQIRSMGGCQVWVNNCFIITVSA